MADASPTLSRGEVVDRYRRLAAERDCSDWGSPLIARLPPWLCHSLIHATDLRRPVSNGEAAFTGRASGAPGRFWKGMLLSPEGPDPKLMQRLPLGGHTPIRAPGIFRWVTFALDELSKRAPQRLSFITEWCSMIVWLTVDPDDPPDVELTSVALPMFPHCTFITHKAIRHIPPKVILPFVGPYALQENLFHEALHQQLAATLLFEDLLARTRAHHAPVVPIPWRAAEWRIDRALHAAWVYHHIIDFRTEQLRQATDEDVALRHALSDSLDTAWEAKQHLVRVLAQHDEWFTPQGTRLLSVLCAASA